MIVEEVGRPAQLRLLRRRMYFVAREPPSSPSEPTTVASPNGQFYFPRVAVKAVCSAYWVGPYLTRTGPRQVQWETKSQYGSGTGQFATVEQSDKGYRVRQCRAGTYAR